MNFSVQHLLAAAKLARDVDAVEPRDPTSPFGDFFDAVLGSSVGCVILCVAGLEAYVNEIFADADRRFAQHERDLLEMIWREFERNTALEKVELALCLLGKGKLDHGAKWVQQVDRLVRLRNALTHYHPERSGSDGHHLELSKKLMHYVARSPWLQGEPLFPRAWATRATSAWAVSSTCEFLTRFAAEAGFEDPVAKFRGRLGTSSGQ
jgi:hypothetical protein